MLSFFETPSSLSKSSDISKPKSYQIRYQFPCGILESIDLFCLILFVGDVIIKSYLISSTRIFKTPWLVAYWIVLFVSIIDCIVSLSLDCNESIRVRRFMRPFFLIQSSSLMKKTIKSLKRALPQIISVFILLLLHLYFFAIVGMLVFPRLYPMANFETDSIKNKTDNNNNTATNINEIKEPNIIFKSILDSLFNLLILVTTSNNPDVLIQSYSNNRYSALYFIIFVMIGIYVIMALLTAVVYNQFKGFFRDSMTSSAFRQSLGVRASYWILYDQFKEEENQSGPLPKSAVFCCIQNLSISEKRKNRLMKNLNEISFCIQDTDDAPTNIDLEQFEKLFLDNFNELDLNTDEDDVSETFSLNQQAAANNETWTTFQTYLFKIKRFFKIIFSSKYYMFFTCLITFINIVCITLELHWFIDENDADNTHEILSYLIFVFSIYYFFENLFKLWSIQWKRYSNDYLNLLDGLISIIFFTLQIVHMCLYGRPYLNRDETRLDNNTTTIWGISRLFNMFFIYRLIHVAPNIKMMYTILSTTIDIITSLRPIIGIMVVFYYVYALIGMQLFQERISLNTFDKLNKSNLDEYCGSYQQLNYWSLNFNDFYVRFLIIFLILNNIIITFSKL
jgi:two pore calcium channel protein 2